MKSKRRKKVTNSNGVVTKQDIRMLSDKIDRNQKALDQIEDVGRIIRENEQNLKDLGGLKHRIDTLDKIMVSVDKIAGSVQSYQQEQTISSNRLSDHEDRLETIEKHLNTAISI